MAMINRDEIGIKIEKYFDGDLSETEKKELEFLLDSDDLVRQEFDFHLQLRRTFEWSFERDALRSKLDRFHSELQAPSVVQTATSSSGTGSLRFILVAASVSLLITTCALFAYHYIAKPQEKHQVYATLNRTGTAEESAPAADSIYPGSATDDDLASVSQNLATAFAFTKDGYLLTNYHVVAGKKHVYVEKFQDSLQTYVAEVVKLDARLDVALLKINDPRFKPFRSIPFVFATKQSLIGQKVFTLGYPKNEIVYSEGPVSSLTGYNSDTIALQLSLPVNPGNSGAPVFTENGEVVGMIMGKNLANDGEAYGVKINHILNFIEKSGIENIQVPRTNSLRNKKVTDQVQSITPFVFLVKA